MPPATLAVTNEAGARVLSLSGRLDASGVAALWQPVHEAIAAPGRIVIDADAVDYCDVAGVTLLVDVLRSRTDSTEIRALRPEFRALLDAFEVARFAPKPAAATPPVRPVESIGRFAFGAAREVYAQIAFLGECAAALAHALLHPSSVRWRDVVTVADRTGIAALPIVSLIAFLMGVILAFQSAIPMRQFGAEIFVADLVGLSMLRELGPLMTAILLAGRTGAAFAAELGTMKVNEEISALATMGLDPMRFLVVPRLLAALIVTPLLTIFADLVGLLGGALTMLSFSIPTTTYFNEMSSFVDLGDFLSGFVKSFVFGLIIAGVGCMKGLATRNDAASVGDSTTRAVVSGIILIVVVDGLFALMYYHLDV